MQQSKNRPFKKRQKNVCSSKLYARQIITSTYYQKPCLNNILKTKKDKIITSWFFEVLSSALFFSLCSAKLPSNENCWGEINRSPTQPKTLQLHFYLFYTLGIVKEISFEKLVPFLKKSLKTTDLVQSLALLLEGRLKPIVPFPLGICRLFLRWALQVLRLSSRLGKQTKLLDLKRVSSIIDPESSDSTIP